MTYSVSMLIVCDVLSISAAGYHYQAKLSDENEEIADWLLRLTETHKRWGFGLCFYFYAIARALNGITSAFTVSTESWSLIFG